MLFQPSGELRNYPLLRRPVGRLLFAAVGAALVVTPLEYAQATPQNAFQAAPTVAVNGSSVLNRFDSSSSSQEDYLVGKNTKGPYTLAWKGLRPASESVVRDGLILHRDTDYTLDPLSGVVTFTTPLQLQQIARVTYQCNPGTAAPNSSSISIPLQWDLFQSGKSSLTFNTLFRNDPATVASQATPLLSSLNWVGNTRFLTNSSLTSGLYVDLRGGDWLDRSAVNLAEKSKFKYADFSLAFARAGKHFLQGAATGLTPGKEISEFLTTLHPSSSMTIKSTLRETTDLPDLSTTPGAVPTTTREGGLALALSLPRNTKIQAGRTETAVTTPGAAGVNTTSDSIKLDTDLSGKTHLAGTFDATAAMPTGAAVSSGQTNPSQGTYAQKSSLQITSKAIDQVSISGSVKNELSSTGTSDAGALSVEATPFARNKKDKLYAKLKVKAGVQSSITPTGVSNSSSAQVEIPNLPVAQASVTGGISHTTDPTRTRTVALLDASAKPSKFLEVSGGARLRDAYLSDNTPDPTSANTYNMKFLFGPSKLVKLTGSVASNPEGSDGTIHHSFAHTVGLESDFHLLKFTGQYGYEQDYTTAKLTNNMLLGVDLRVTAYDTFSTIWEGHSILDTALSETSIYRLAFTHKLGTLVDVSLSGSMTQTALNGINSPNGAELKAEAKIGLHF